MVAILLAAGGLYFFKGPHTATATSAPAEPASAERRGAGGAPPVVVDKVTERADDALVDVTGSGLALRSAVLRPAAAGEVAGVNFKAGDRVRAGQLLLRLDDRNQRLAVEAAANQLDAARRLQARYDTTVNTGAVPGSVIDQARTAAKSAEIALAQAQAALADRALLAPFSGVVGLAAVQRGDRVGVDTAVTTLDDRSALRVAFAVPEEHIGRLGVGQHLKLSHNAYPGRSFAGRIAQIDSRVDVATRTVRIEADVPNRDDVLRGGMSFRLRLALDGDKRLAVPELALQWGRDGAYVWTVRGGKAVQVPVQALRRREGQVLVQPRPTRGEAATAPLTLGETVVVEGVQRLRDGAAVQVVGNGRGSGNGGEDSAAAPDAGATNGSATNGSATNGSATNGDGASSASVAPAAGVRP